MDSSQIPSHDGTKFADKSSSDGSDENSKEQSEKSAKFSTDATQKTTTEVGAPPSSLTSDGFSWGGYFQSIGILLLLLAALWGLVWFLRKYGRFNFIPRPGAFPHDGLRMEAQLPLGPRKGLTVVRFLDKRLLLGVTEHQITLLQEIEDNREKGNMDFQTHLDNAVSKEPEDNTLLHGPELVEQNTDNVLVTANSDNCNKNNDKSI